MLHLTQYLFRMSSRVIYNGLLIGHSIMSRETISGGRAAEEEIKEDNDDEGKDEGDRGEYNDERVSESD